MTHKILVVDDEKNMLVLLQRVLSREGYQVACAESGQAALELAAQIPFALAVVDIIMPAMDGISLIKKLKAINGDMPVIAISARPSSEREAAALKSGSTCFLSKPIDIRQLKKLIRSLLSVSATI